MYNWIKEHKNISLLMILLLISLFTLLINLLYKVNSVDWIESEWDAGDFLSFFGSILTFVSTIILGYATLTINEKATSLSEKLFDMQKDNSKAIATIDTKRTMLFFMENKGPILSNRIQQPGIHFSVDYGNQDEIDIMIMEFYLINITDNVITNVRLDEFNIKNIITNTIIKPIRCGDESGVVLNKSEDIKVIIILSGLRKYLGSEKAYYFHCDYGTEINCVMSFKNLYNQKSNISIVVTMKEISYKKELGEKIYKIYTKEFFEIN